MGGLISGIFTFKLINDAIFIGYLAIVTNWAFDLLLGRFRLLESFGFLLLDDGATANCLIRACCASGPLALTLPSREVLLTHFGCKHFCLFIRLRSLERVLRGKDRSDLDGRLERGVGCILWLVDSPRKDILRRLEWLRLLRLLVHLLLLMLLLWSFGEPWCV